MPSPEQLSLEGEDQMTIDDELDFQFRRAGRLVKGCIGMIRLVDTFTIEEVEERHSQGLGTPLDLMPNEFWSPKDLPFPRFGEEMLGKDF